MHSAHVIQLGDSDERKRSGCEGEGRQPCSARPSEVPHFSLPQVAPGRSAI